MKKVYIAGSLFKAGDIKERKYEGAKLRAMGLNVFNPTEAPFNEDKNAALPSAQTIFWGDTQEVLSSDMLFAEYDGEDPGVMAELGIAWAINHLHDYFAQGHTIQDFQKVFPRKTLVGHASDIRIPSAHKYRAHYVPMGLNQYVVGLIESQGQLFINKNDAFAFIRKICKSSNH